MKEAVSIIVGVVLSTTFSALLMAMQPELRPYTFLLGMFLGGFFSGLTFLVLSK